MKKQLNSKFIIGRSHIPLISRLIGIEVLFLVSILLVDITFNGSIFQENFYLLVQSITVFTLLISNVVLVLFTLLEWLGKKYVIRENDITVHKGFITNSRKVIKSSHIESVEIQQNILEKIFRYGTVRIYSPMLREMIYLRNVTQPKEVVKHIKKIFRNNKQKNILLSA